MSDPSSRALAHTLLHSLTLSSLPVLEATSGLLVLPEDYPENVLVPKISCTCKQPVFFFVMPCSFPTEHALAERWFASFYHLFLLL